MITKLSVLFPELTTAQLNDLSEWLSTKCKSTLGERIQDYLEKNGSASLRVISNRVRLSPAATIKGIKNLIDRGVIERYSAGEPKTKYRIKK